jgi:predicted  nucleic acid-binding Zn-ribbon protein
MNHKCTECGNTFKIEAPNNDDIITCPTCEANYKTKVKDGKTTLTEYVYESEDLGEL